VLPASEEADEAEEDLTTFLGKAPVRLPEVEPGDVVHLSNRIRAVRRLSEGALVVASARAVCQPLPVEAGRVLLEAGHEHPREMLLKMLADSTLERTHRVEQPGEYAVRGGLVDLFPFGMDRPLRVDYFGDVVESIRVFDADDQKTQEKLERAEFSLQALEGEQGVADLLPDGAWVALREPAEVGDEAWPAVVAGLMRRPALTLQSLPGDGTNFRTLSLQRFSGALANIPRELEGLSRREITVFCATRGEADRLRELLRDAGVDVPLRIVEGRVNRGFVFEEIGAAIVPNHELFNRYRLRRPPRRPGAQVMDVLAELEPGDLVVHVTHGIGRFLRLEELKGQEYLVIEYQGGARLFVPAANADLIQKYLGGSERGPALSTLGGKAWSEAKARAQKSAEGLAKELLHVQAMRELEPGISYPEDSEWQRAFEAAFPYEETDDQLTVAEQMAADMSAPRPMDRLVCGDVGYGKTELAMRAAFRAVTAHRQVAVLVPTTVLAAQHYQTFRERMADYPFVVEMLSRFRTKKEQKEILDRIAAGAVDIVIGTHRLVQKDVVFKDLGLVVIDEEQRFGVEHKERLKQLRAIVDVLTLTATPIPRTLHMSLLGIKDISSLATPPQDRRSIRTEVLLSDDRRIRKAIRHEIDRGGQVYFVHNRVWNIRSVAAHLEMLVPEAKFGIGHGQMDARTLEETMLRFLAKEIDVLVATTIIESGLDIPNVNTMLINNADQFGLADLHQLRGRVGRYKRQAYCHLLLPRDRPILPQAKRRIKAIEEFSELGAGFRIAMRDLEIRGVGNLLGREQSGHIAAIGYELYCRMMEKAVRRAQKKAWKEPVETAVDLGVEARIPGGYIPDLRARIEAYRRLCAARDMRELERARAEVEDRFGKLPEAVEQLMQVLAIKILAGSRGFTSVARGDRAAVCRYRDRAKAEALRRKRPDAVRIVDSDFLHRVLDGSPILDRVLKLLA
jgi:transcription-repair coupling factor (superfamily II helicase)